MDAGVVVPRAYILSRSAGPGLVQAALDAFSITPICCVIISSPQDSSLARQFGAIIIRTESELDAMKFCLQAFSETQMPGLVIGSRSGITAFYDDGRVEDLPWLDHDFLIN